MESSLTTTEHIFYDGDCGACHWAVSFVARHDRDGRTFRFAALGGETFDAKLDAATRANLPDSMLVTTSDQRLLMRSAAVIHILRRLGGRWRFLASFLGLVPRPLRDLGYDMFARLRKHWLRQPQGACPVLPPSLGCRFDP